MKKFNGKMKCDDCCKDLPSPLHAMVTMKRPGVFCKECVWKPVDEDPTDEPFRMLDVVRAPKTGILYVVECNASLRNVNEPWSGYELAYRANDDAVTAFSSGTGIEFVERIQRVKHDAWFCTHGDYVIFAYTNDFKSYITASATDWSVLSSDDGWFNEAVKRGVAHPESAKRWLEMHKVNVLVTEKKNSFRELMNELGGAGLHLHAAHYYGLLPNVTMDTGWSEAVDRELRTRMAERWSDPCFASRPSCDTCGSVIRNCAHTNWVCKCGSLSYVADYMSDEQKETARRHGREEYEFTLRCGGPYTVAGSDKRWRSGGGDNIDLIRCGSEKDELVIGETSGTIRVRNGKYDFGPVKPEKSDEYVLPDDLSKVDCRPGNPVERLAGEMVKIGGITFEQALVFAEMKIAQEKIDKPMVCGPDPYNEHREKLADDSAIGWNDDRTGEDDEMVALETDLKQYGSSKPKFILDQIPEPKVKPSKPHPWECDENEP